MLRDAPLLAAPFSKDTQKVLGLSACRLQSPILFKCCMEDVHIACTIQAINAYLIERHHT